MNSKELIYVVRADMAAHGVATNDKLIADGVLHRAYAEGDKAGTLNISYIIHADGNPSWYFEYFPAGIKQTGTLSGERKRLSLSERRQIEAERKRRQLERKERQKQAAEKANSLWHKGVPVPSMHHHGYLIRKGVKPYQIRLYQGSLMVPIYNEARELINLQFINADGTKRFLAGGKKKECFSVIGSACRRRQDCDLRGLGNRCQSACRAGCFCDGSHGCRQSGAGGASCPTFVSGC
jgi:putative DNA primase/helicase